MYIYLAKVFTHEDFTGVKGDIGPGSTQWMTAGRGIVHSEMPANGEVSEGLQLWVNLAGKDKMCEPGYQEFLAKDIPKASIDGITASVISGSTLGVTSPVKNRTPVYYFHFWYGIIHSYKTEIKRSNTLN
jgi:redox-sensitive bicupin YhaK (pirin superfamily)